MAGQTSLEVGASFGTGRTNQELLSFWDAPPSANFGEDQV